MKIAINATTFNNTPSGANQRFFGIYPKLFKLLPKINFIIFTSSDFGNYQLFNKFNNVRIVKTPINSNNRLQKFFFGFFYWNFVCKEKYNFLEGFHLPFFLKDRTKGILTLHDVRGLYHKLFFFPFLYKLYLNLSIRKIKFIISVSNSIRKEILYFYPNIKIYNVENGINLNLLTKKGLSFK